MFQLPLGYEQKKVLREFLSCAAFPSVSTEIQSLLDVLVIMRRGESTIAAIVTVVTYLQQKTKERKEPIAPAHLEAHHSLRRIEPQHCCRSCHNHG